MKQKKGTSTYLGDLEKFVIKAILDQSNNAYGVQIKDRLHEKLGREFSYAAIYTTLDRLEQKGFLSSKKGEATAERGGKAKIFFQVTGTGQRALDAALSNFAMLGFSLQGV